MPEPITQSDLDELYQAARLFTFPGFCKQETLFKIHAHLTTQLAQPVPSREQAYVIISDPLVTFMKIESYDFDGTPVTFEGEVTKRSGHDVPISLPDEEDDESEELIFPDLYLKANQHIINQIAAMNADDLKATTTRREVTLYTCREPLSPDWRREYAPLDMDKYESDQ